MSVPYSDDTLCRMDDTDALKQAFRGDAAPLTRRQRRAARTRARALSPTRILVQLLMVPIVTVALTVSIYIRTSPFEPPDGLRHLLAMGGCDVAAKLNISPSFRGDVGYHPRNDPDGDGIACGSALATNSVEPSPPTQHLAPGQPVQADPTRISGAKFLRP